MRQNESHSPNERQQVQEIRKRYATALRTDDGFSMEQVIESAPEQLRSLLVSELISAELDWHRELGTTPPLGSYIKRFPDQVDVITKLNRRNLGDSDQMPPVDSLDVPCDETRVVSNPSRSDEGSRTFSPRDTLAGSVRESGKSKSKSHSTSFLVPDNQEGWKYRVEHEIDRGGMGAIFQVRDLQLDRTLAMKVILGQKDGSRRSFDDRAPEKLERFFREASITSRLDHPGVVPVHELGKDEDGRSYFTMKLVQGKTLKQVFKELKTRGGPWNRARVIEVLIRVCDTIAFAHSKGVIHRDLKPANIMVGEFGETYVMDWGLAKILREQEKSPTSTAPSFKPEMPVDSSRTMDGSIMGTPQYMPPEQASGRIDDLDERSDIYSLGALLYQMLSGHKPFHQHKTGMNVVRAVSKEPPIAILQHTKKAPAELVAIANKAMQREQEDRYTNATEMADDLRAFLDNRVVAAYRTGWAAKVEKFVVRNRSIIATAMLLLVTSLSVIAFLQFRNNENLAGLNDKILGNNKSLESLNSKLDTKRSELEQSLASEEKANDRLKGQKLVLEAKNIIAKNSDATLASLLAVEALERYKYDSVETQSTIYSSASRLSESLILKGHQDRLTQAIFSPDGKLVLTISADGTGIVWDATTGKQVSLILNRCGINSRLGMAFETAVFSSSGTRILAAGSDINAGTVGVWETKTGDRKLLIDIDAPGEEMGPRSSVSMVQFFPDEKRLIAATSAGMLLYDSSTGEQVGTLKTHSDSESDRVSHLHVSPDGTRVVAGLQNGQFFVWDVASESLVTSGNVQATNQGVAEQERSLDLNSNGSLFLTASGEGSKSTARIWNTATGELHSELNLGLEISAAAFHPNRNLLMVGVNDLLNPTVKLWDLDAEKIVSTSTQLPAVPGLIRFSPQGNAFVVKSGNANLSVWELESNHLNETIIRDVEDLVGHSQQVSINDARFDASGSRVVSASTDRTARIWNVFSERPVVSLGRTWFPGSCFTNHSIKVNSKGNRIFAFAADRQSVNLWSYPELDLIKSITIADPNVFWQFSYDGDLLFGSSKSGTCFCWNTTDGSLVREFKNVGRLISASSDPATGRVILNTRENASAWNLADINEKPEHQFPKSEEDYRILNPRGSVAVSFSFADNSLQQLVFDSGEARTLPVDTCQAVAFSPDGRYLWCKGSQFENEESSQSTSIMILDGQDFSLKYEIEDDGFSPRWIKSADFSPDSSRILVEHYKMRGEETTGPAFSIWSTADGSKICEIGDYGSTVIWKATNRDFSRLLLNTNDGPQLIDGTSGVAIADLQLSIGKFTKAVFSRDGKYFLSQEVSETKNPLTGRPESQVALWDASTGDLLVNLPRNHSRFVGDFHPDSSCFITVSETNQVQVWPIDMIAESKKYVSRSLTQTEQDFYLAESEVGTSSDQRQIELAELEDRIRLLGSITADRRHEAWRVLAQFKSWLGDDPSQVDVELAIERSAPLLSGPYDSDPTILAGIAEFYSKQDDGSAAIRLLEHAARHPRRNFETDQLETARQTIAPAVASFRSADWIAKQFQQDGEVPARFTAAANWARENNAVMYQYLTAQERFVKQDFEAAAGLLKSVVDSRPTDPEPYVLYANCLRAQSNAKAAAEVLRDALDIKECRAPEIWKTWLQISFNDLGKSPKQLLDDLPDPTGDISMEPDFGAQVRWLLTQLVNGAPLRINSGCYTNVNVGGETWAADCFYTYGLAFWEQDGESKPFDQPIADTDKDILYQSERYFPTTGHYLPAGYQLPLPNGKYEITLGFSEIYDDFRRFDVTVEDKLILENYDPAHGKFATAEEVSFEVDLGDGLLNIELESHNTSPAKISTISINLIPN